MPAKENLTTAADITVKAREIDFVTRFTKNWDSLREILGIMRPIRKTPGTTLTSWNASVTLADGNVGEGEEIPYSKATVKPVTFEDLTLRKYAKAVSIEAVNKYGAEVAIQRTDNEFLNELQMTVLTEFYEFLATGTLKGTATNLQEAIAQSVGLVTDKFKKAHLDYSQIVTFINTMDYFNYLGTANLSLQQSEGITYLQNFLGARSVIISSEIKQGTVISTPTSNIDLYYVDPSDSDFGQLGLNYTVAGDTNLIGFHAQGDYGHAVGEEYALMGMKLWAEYLDGISNVPFGTTSAGAKKAS